MDIEILRSAARELCGFIDRANTELDKCVLRSAMEPPDHHDHQTVHELDVFADTLSKSNAKAIKKAYMEGIEDGRRYSVYVAWEDSDSCALLHKESK